MSSARERFEAWWPMCNYRDETENGHSHRATFCAGYAAGAEAMRENLRGAMLTPEQLEGTADWMMKRCDLDNNAHVLAMMVLRQKAKALRALPLEEKEESRG